MDHDSRNNIPSDSLPTKTNSDSLYADNVKSKRHRLFPSVRLGMLVLMFFGCMLSNATFYILNYSFVCMIDPKYLIDDGKTTNISGNNGNDKCPNSSTSASSSAFNGTFQWDKTAQSTILAGESWGSIWFIFAAGYVMNKYGARYSFAFANLLLGVITIVIPFVSPFGWQYCFVARILQGIGMLFAWPVTFVLAVTWFPTNELGVAIAVPTAGFEVGGVLSQVIAGIFCGTKFGWPMAFYLFGTIAILYAILWVSLYGDIVLKYPFISDKEKHYIMEIYHKEHGLDEMDETDEKQQFAVPWKRMFTSIRLLSLTIISITGGYYWYYISDYIPQYLDSVLRIGNSAKGGLYSALPYLTSLISVQISGPLSDWVETKISRTVSVKIFSAVAICASCLSLGVIPLFSCTTYAYAVAMFSVSFFCYSISTGGFTKSIAQLAPTYTGMVAGITTTALYVGGILAPYVTSAITRNNTAKEWHLSIYVTVGVSLFGLGQFLILGSGKVQSWDPTFKEENEGNEPIK